MLEVYFHTLVSHLWSQIYQIHVANSGAASPAPGPRGARAGEAPPCERNAGACRPRTWLPAAPTARAPARGPRPAKGAAALFPSRPLPGLQAVRADGAAAPPGPQGAPGGERVRGAGPARPPRCLFQSEPPRAGHPSRPRSPGRPSSRRVRAPPGAAPGKARGRRQPRARRANRGAPGAPARPRLPGSALGGTRGRGGYGPPAAAPPPRRSRPLAAGARAGGAWPCPPRRARGVARPGPALPAQPR